MTVIPNAEEVEIGRSLGILASQLSLLGELQARQGKILSQIQGGWYLRNDTRG